ncbi:MAG TPA: glycosyltransferase family 2 protein [Methylomirabilota bacterium]|nr:glycosyltransferase family 2 protein [Methylomirabilota bacterium]
MSPRVCAIVLDFFGADKTKKSVSSLAGQNLETVYVLDNSGCRTAEERLWRSMAEIESTGPFRIHILTARTNLGFAKGVNFVIAHDLRSEAPHDYYLLLNNDAVAGPDLVSKMLAEFQRDPSIALVAPRILCDDPGREFGIWYHRYFGALLSKPGWGRFHYFTGCCLLFPRRLASAAGIFDESFFMYGEDVELGWRLTCQNMKMVCASAAFVQHDLGPSALRSSLFYEYHMTRGHLLLSKITYRHRIELPLLVVTKIITLSLRVIFRVFRHQAASPAIAWLLVWFPKTWIDRCMPFSPREFVCGASRAD